MLKKLFILTSLLVLLTGCVPAALVVGATAGGAVVYDKRSFKTMTEDHHIAQIAQNRLAYTKALQGTTHISVATFNHVTLMVGQAKTENLRRTAYQVVSSVPGSKRIYNEVVIAKPTSFWRRSDDTWITTKAKAAMLGQKGLESSQVKVITENGVVYLMGLVTHGQAKLAAAVARRISGVKKVVKVFQYSE